eukprot:1176655-Prorocentrum_minimum.AAC.3
MLRRRRNRGGRDGDRNGVWEQAGVGNGELEDAAVRTSVQGAQGGGGERGRTHAQDEKLASSSTIGSLLLFRAWVFVDVPCTTSPPRPPLAGQPPSGRSIAVDRPPLPSRWLKHLLSPRGRPVCREQCGVEDP